MSTPVDQLRERHDQLAALYNFRFANKPRATRDLDILDRMIADADTLVADIRANLAAGELLSRAIEQAELFRAERRNIVQAQNEGPGARDAALLAARANAQFARYRRHFAGQSRESRDAALLAEIIDDLEKIQRGMARLLDKFSADWIRRDLEIVTENLAMYRKEADEIENARKSGTPGNRASRLATLANAQFALYATHFAGKSRMTRRPELLQRMIESLEAIAREMAELQGEDLNVDVNRTNQGIVNERLGIYRIELAEIRKLRTSTSFDDLAGTLGGAANEIMDEYGKEFAGKDRGTRSLARLGELCDLLGEVERQMTALESARDHKMNATNVAIVRDSLRMLDDEWTAVRDAQQKPKT